MNPVTAFIGAYLLGEIYERYASPAFKAKLQSLTDAHHGEGGILTAIIGHANKSPALTAFGLGLAFHDHKDANEWFTGKRRYQS
jgi:hypothetical protein